MPAPSRTPVALKRKRTEQLRGKTAKRATKKVRRQREYHSSSEDESADEQQPKAVDAYESASSSEEEVDDAPELIMKDDDTSDAELEDAPADGSDDEGAHADSDEEDEDDDSDAASSTAPSRNKKKRNDPDAFAISMQKILGSKLSTSKRADPILSRSKIALDAGKELAESKLEAKARNKLREEKHALLEKGRVKDVLGLNSPDVSTQQIQEEERRLKKTAQRGVVKLFNAVRAAQVKGEQAAREAKMKGVVGVDKREEKVTEMSKKGFLDLIAGGGKKTAAA
ncbi:Rrp15p-domain-containing protein [Macrophomina phaseolina]|uniref:Rrp15p-domain-containing protein n=1 Tax=Macrophomina phaseolina TaxID=35725 RepID=A0ABQ8GFF2_9PEZI|nr:Rrp15p-domain-containing protein [Macrophomina phaseolina]